MAATRKACSLLCLLSLCFAFAWATSAAVPYVTASPTPVIPYGCEPDKTPKLKIDTALLTLTVVNTSVENQFAVVVYLQSTQCYECDLIPAASVYSTNNCSLRVDSRWPTRVQIQAVEKSQIKPPSLTCREEILTTHFIEGGEYDIFLTKSDTETKCNLVLLYDPPDPFIPIYVALGIGFFCLVLWTFGKYLYRKGYVHRILCFWSTENMMSDLGTPTNINRIDETTASGEIPKPVVKERLKSLDTFRGISIIVMIFVNYGGGKYWFFKHSKWNGLTVADLVFPWFVFIMGTAMAFSFQGQLRRNVLKWKIFLKILKRSATLFLLGLLINSFGVRSGVDFDTFRIPGVLQRFAGTYLITATVHLFLAPAPPQNPNQAQFTRFAAFRDIYKYWPEWIINICFVAVHTALTMAMPVPGCPRGYLGPGGLEDGGLHFNCTGGAAGYIDRKFFGDAHIYQSPTSKEIYKSTVPYDPEGLLGTLNSCVLCFLGLQAGKILLIHTDWVKRCKRFLVWSIVLAGIGTLLCEGSLNDGWIPINKNLWSLSFITILSGMAFFVLMICYILIDVYKVWSGAPFYYAGMNSIALYCGHEFFDGRAPVWFKVSNTHTSLLTLNIWGTAFWVIVSIYFYYKDIFISV